MSRELFIIRHAKSSWANERLSDFDRPLNSRGKSSVKIMGNYLAGLDLAPDYLIYSAAKRTTETYLGLSEYLNLKKTKIVSGRQFYHASAEFIIQSASEIPDEYKQAIYIGHNPGVTDAVNMLCHENISNVPTLGIAQISFEIDSWKEVFPGLGKLISFDYPKKFE